MAVVWLAASGALLDVGPIAAAPVAPAAAPAAGTDAGPSAPVAASEAPAAAADSVERLREAGRSDAIALHFGRYLARKGYDALLDQTMYAVSPRGTWDGRHPAWARARAQMDAAFRRESLAWLATDENRARLRRIVDEVLDSVKAEDRERAVRFYESSAGRAFLDRRVAYAAEVAWGVPFADVPPGRDAVVAASERAKARLMALPEDGDGQVVYDFTNSPLGEQLRGFDNPIAERMANVLRSALEEIAIERRDAFAREIRATLGDAVPPPTDKSYLGTVSMRPDRALAVHVEYDDRLRRVGTYDLVFAPDHLHYAEVLAAAPGLSPGATRPLFRARDGTLGDRP